MLINKSDKRKKNILKLKKLSNGKGVRIQKKIYRLVAVFWNIGKVFAYESNQG